MPTIVNFYKWSGRVDEAPKILDNQTDWQGREIINTITDVITSLSMTIELDKYYHDSNYVVFVANGRTYNWFIENVTNNKGLYYYNLTLDVLNTYWDLYAPQQVFIERCGIKNLGDSETYFDSLWKVPMERVREKHNLYTFEGIDWNSHCIALSVFTTNAIVGNDDVNPHNNGSIQTYLITPNQLKYINDRMWESNWLEQIANYLADVTGFFQKIVLYPLDLYNGGTAFVTSNTIKPGPLNLATISENYLIPLNNNFIIDCGTYTLPKYFNDYRDYSPYTDINVFLPYVGFKQIDRQNFGDSVTIKYVIEFSSGTGSVNLYRKYLGSEILVETIPCELGINLPITTNGYGDIMFSLGKIAMNSTATLIGSVGAVISSGGTNPSGGLEKVLEHSTALVPADTNRAVSDHPFILPDRDLPEPSNNKPTQSIHVSPSVKGYLDTPVTDTTAHNNFDMGFVTGSALWNYRDIFFTISYPNPDYDKKQNDLYGKLYMGVNTLSNIKTSLDLSNMDRCFVKLSGNSLDTMGLPLSIYDEIYKMLTKGIYII